MIPMVIQVGTGRLLKKLASSKGIRLTARKCPKTTAPATITRTIQDVRRVSKRARFSMGKLSFLRTKAMMRAPKAPMDAASVGVKKPANIPPITTIKRSRVSITPFKEASLCKKGKEGALGPFSGCRLH